MICVGHLIRRYLRLTETFIQAYLTHAKMHRPQVFTDVLFPQTAGNTACTYLIDQQELNRMSQSDVRFFFSQLDFPNCFYRLFCEQEIEVLHTHFGSLGFRSLQLKEKLGVPLISSFYGIDASQMISSGQYDLAFSRLFDRADAVIALGSDMARRLCLAGCSERKIHVIHLGVDLKKISYQPRTMPGDDSPITLLYCGRLVKKKGIEDALYAFARVVDRYPNLVFRIVGDGPLRLSLLRRIREMDLSASVQVLGALPHRQVLMEMARAHLFVLPSKMAHNGDMEGTPTVLLEAQASGLPVLSTLHADIPEVVLDGETGFLVPEDDSNALAKKLTVLLDHPVWWSDFGRKGRAHVRQHYNIRKEIKKLESLYAAVI